MEDIQVSIIIPIHERNIFLEECVQSVVRQSLRAKEVLCILDGECPTSKQIVDKYTSDTLRVITREKEGAGASRNLGIELARGEYICFMDSDDYYTSDDAIEKLYLAAKQNQALICGGNINMVFEDGNAVPMGDVFRYERYEDTSKRPQMFGHTGYIYNRLFLVENDIKNVNLRRFEEPIFVIKAFSQAKKYYVIKDVVYSCRQYERNYFYDYETLRDILRGVLICTDYLCSITCAHIYEQYIFDALRSIYEQYACFLSSDRSEIIQLTNMIAKNMESMGIEIPDILRNDPVKAYVQIIKDKLNAIKQSEKIAIYGAGKVAKTLLDLDIIALDRIKNCYVSNSNDNVATFCGIDVKAIDEFNDDVLDLIIVAADGKNAKEMEGVLMDLGVKRYICLNSREMMSLYQLKYISEGKY